VARARALLETGGAKVAELDALLLEVEQFLWGPAEVSVNVPALEKRLCEAKTWVGQVCPLPLHTAGALVYALPQASACRQTYRHAQDVKRPLAWCPFIVTVGSRP
jgi:hypothetical protein